MNGKKNKDHLKDHAEVRLLQPDPPGTEDPLRFWTDHPTRNMQVNLHPFADGQFEHPNTGGSKWSGPFTGRRELIEELAPALQARLALLLPGSVHGYLRTLRAWWRLFDHIEAVPGPDGKTLTRVASVGDLNSLHGAFALRAGLLRTYVSTFLSVANDVRRLQHLFELVWEVPKDSEPIRHLMPDDQARELKTTLKQHWLAVRAVWARNDALRAEAELRDAGQAPASMTSEEECLIDNWRHLQRIQQATGCTLPSGEQLMEGRSDSYMAARGLERKKMRAILFPTVEEADIAFHLALFHSGWNPSTLANLDAVFPFLISDHPKDPRQLVLYATESSGEEATLQADKPRARAKTQFCTGLKKHISSAPAIVAAYLLRVAPLREQLRADHREAARELARQQASNADEQVIGRQFKRAQRLQQGVRSAWLYVDRSGDINWISHEERWARYSTGTGQKLVSYLDRVRKVLNAAREKRGELPIAKVVPADCRDIVARWVYKQSGGSILAVMSVLGHASVKSAVCYLENNIINEENDAHARRFLTSLMQEMAEGRVDLTLLAQFVRHGPATPEMLVRLKDHRRLMRSRVGVGCVDPRHPPAHVAPSHKESKLCSTQRCLMIAPETNRCCPHAKFLPESLGGIAMRVEELRAMSYRLPMETWLRGGFHEEHEMGEALLTLLFAPEQVTQARDAWRERITRGEHLIPGLGRIAQDEGEDVTA